MKRLLLLTLLIAGTAFAQSTKISDLPDGSPGQATDAIPIARAGANYKLPFSAFAPTWVGGANLSTFRVYIPDQTTLQGSFALGTGGSHLINAGIFSHTGEGSEFFGIEAGDANTDAAYNTFIGWRAGKRTTTGSQNTFVGTIAGEYMTTGTGNVFLGAFAGQNSTGDNNVAIGTDAGHSMNTGDDNVIIGTSAGTSLQTGNGNTYVGYTSGPLNVSSTGNTCVGFFCLLTTTGSNNIALGYTAGRFETGSYKLFVDSYSRGSEAENRSLSIIYGVMGATVKAQMLTINAFMALSGIAFADLGTPANGTFAYCSDCLVQASCAGSGAGALAKRLNGAWVCN